jgi:hypothetical protein
LRETSTNNNNNININNNNNNNNTDSDNKATITYKEDFIMATNWATLEPQYNILGVHVPKLKVLLDVGSFVSFMHGDGTMVVELVARIVDWKVVDTVVQIQVNVFQRVGETGHQDPVSRWMVQLSQCQRLTWITVDKLIDICYVFLRSTVDSLLYICQGRKDCYVTERRFDGSDYDAFLPFPCDCGERFPLEVSYQKQVWIDIDKIRVMIRKLLASTRKDQGNFQKRVESCSISLKAWKYMLRQVEGEIGFDVCLSRGQKRSRSENVLLPGMSSISKKRSFSAEVLVFNGLDMLVSLLGESSVFGVRHKPPKLGESAQAIVGNDVINYIVNCKMSYDSMCKLSLTLWYKPYHTQLSRNGTPMNCSIVRLSRILRRMRPANEDVETSSASSDCEDDVLIDIGDQFIINQIVYTVVGKSETTCQVVSGTATSDDRISMPIGVVAEHIKSYLE